MNPKPQIKIPAVYMRGGTSKGVFFKLPDLPVAARAPGAARDRLLLRVIGSPDPYGKHTDGMGAATSSTSKVVILSAATKPGHDVDYLFGQVSIDKPHVDWSGNCGNLTAAVGPCAIMSGLIKPAPAPNGVAAVRIWQANIGKTIIAHVPIADGAPQESGDFELDGVAFPAAEIKIDFISPVDAGEALFPTGHIVERLRVDGVGEFDASMISAGIPTIFINAAAMGYNGTELQEAINTDTDALAKFEAIRAAGAVKMGLSDTLEQAAAKPHTPKVAFVAPAADYTASSGRAVKAGDIDLNVRALSMGRLHHAMMGTAAVAIAAAAAAPGSLVNLAAGGGAREAVTFGHPSGALTVGATVGQDERGAWRVDKVSMSRSARTLMEGHVCVPGDIFD